MNENAITLLKIVLQRMLEIHHDPAHPYRRIVKLAGYAKAVRVRKKNRKRLAKYLISGK